MDCPACDRSLCSKDIGPITVDICDDGCGGIWFDNFELKKVDEPHESAGESLLQIRRDPQIHVDLDQRRHCPSCQDTLMMQHFFSVKHKVTVDECPRCGGIWLDYGELGQIRELFKSEEERREAARKYFNDLFGKEMADAEGVSRDKMEQKQKIARMFRFICPSHYIPGKQDWGAF